MFINGARNLVEKILSTPFKQLFSEETCISQLNIYFYWKKTFGDNCYYYTKKGKGSPYSITECRVPELIQVLGSQPAGDVSHKPSGRLPLLSARPAVTPATLKEGCYQFCCLVNTGTIGVNSLPKTVARQHRNCDLNPGPSAPESSTLTTQLPNSYYTTPV